jgi:N-acyl-D-aspartate/D-glutamate deacylase
MSQRHRLTDVVPPSKEELRAQAHSERHRIHVELQEVAQQVSAGLDPADVHEPGAAWKPLHHRDPDVARGKLAKRKRSLRHWKQKMWKRRTAMRQAKAEAMRLAGES